MTLKKTSFFHLPLLVALGALPACTSLHSVSVTQIPRDRSKPVHAEESNTAFLGLHFDNDFIDPLRLELEKQCPGGKVTGIVTKHESTSYFIVSTRRVEANGFCVYEASGIAPSGVAPDPSLRSGVPATAPQEAPREATAQGEK
jgi:hypothetical protein